MPKYIIILFVLLAACDTYVEDQRTAEFQPMYFQDAEETDDDTDFGSIYQQDKGSLFAMEGRAHRVGDILTVSFTESFQATKSQNAATSRASENKLSLPTVMQKLPVIGNGIPEDAEFTSSGESCLLYTSPSPRDRSLSRMPSSA